MVTKTDIIKSNKNTGCNNCIFCFSKCLKCGALDITVEYRNIFPHYKYRNKIKDHIYVTRLNKKFNKKSLMKPPVLNIHCNKCKNKITVIGERTISDNIQYLYSYNRNNPNNHFRSNSKYYNQAKFLFQFLDKNRMIPFDRMMISAQGFHVYIDRTDTSRRVHFLKIEWYEGDWVYYQNNRGIVKGKRKQLDQNNIK